MKKYKVWVHIEECTTKGLCEYHTDVGEPVSVATIDDLSDAVEIVQDINIYANERGWW